MLTKNRKRRMVISLLPMICLVFFGASIGVYTFCEMIEKNEDIDLEVPNVMVNGQDPLLDMDNGKVLYNGLLFSGRIFQRTGQGAPISEERYLNGERHGLSRRWHAGGQLAYEHHFEHGKKQGEQIGWWRNGEKKYSYGYRDNLPHGKAIEFFRNGDLARVSNFENGIENGHQRNWDLDGLLTSNYVVRDGRRYGQVIINRFHSGELTQLAANGGNR